MSPLNQITLTDLQMGRVAAVMREANVSFDDAIDMIFKANTTFNYATDQADRAKMYIEHKLKLRTNLTLYEFIQMSDADVEDLFKSFEGVPNPETPSTTDKDAAGAGKYDPDWLMKFSTIGLPLADLLRSAMEHPERVRKLRLDKLTDWIAEELSDKKTEASDAAIFSNWAKESILKIHNNLKNQGSKSRTIMEVLMGDAKVDWTTTKTPNARTAELIRIIDAMWNHDHLLSLENFPCRCGKPDCLSELRAEHHQRLQEAFKAGGKKQWIKTLIEILEQLRDDTNSKKD